MVVELVRWFEQNQRALPWRSAYDPYHVWVSEVMLQQTQVETALPYYNSFLNEFPTIEALAGAPEERVLKLWAGLGYYQRARNLLAAAREVVGRHGGSVPSEYESLIALPGVGRYMAGAIMSIAFNKPYPIVDGNVRRVLSRINGWFNDDPKAQWEAAEDMVRTAEPRMVNQALMELGATVCSFKAPRCLLCPVQGNCVAFRIGKQGEIPAARKRADTVRVSLVAVVHRKNGRYLMKAADGFWEFPTFAKMPAGDFEKVGSCRHSITHHRLDVRVYRGALNETDGYVWKEIETVPISSLTKKIAALGVSGEG